MSKEKIKHNDYEREPVPQEKRVGWLKLTVVWAAMAICLSATVLGGSLGGGLSLSNAIWASLIGSLVLSTIAAFSGFVGAKTGLSTAMVSKFSLGEWGSYAVGAVIAIALLGWFGVQLDLGGSSFAYILKDMFNYEANKSLLIILGGIAMTTTALIGFKAIEKLSEAAVPLMSLLLFVSLFLELRERSLYEISQASIVNPLMFGGAVSLVIGSFAVGAVMAPDIARYARSPKDAVISAFGGFTFAYLIILTIASILGKATNETDIVKIILGLGWGSFSMIILILGQWTTNDNNLYSSALGFSVIFKKLSKAQLTFVAGIIGTILSLSGIYGQFIPFLIFLSILIPPIGGICAADYLQRKEDYQFSKLDQVKTVNVLGISTWALSSLFAFMTTPSPNGFGLFELTGASGADAFIVAFVLQSVLVFSRKKAQN